MDKPVSDDAESGPIHSLLEHASLFALPVMLGVLFYITHDALHARGAAWSLWFAVPCALLLGDFFTGLVHWFCDTYGSENTPVLGRSIILHFRLHHVNPLSIREHGLVATNGNSAILGVVVITIALGITITWGKESVLLAWGMAVMTFASVVAGAANQVHKWAHSEDNGPVIRFLQKHSLLLNAKHHEEHHVYPHDRNYCISLGWMDWPLEKIDFWRRSERLLLRLGVRPGIDISARRPSNAKRKAAG